MYYLVKVLLAFSLIEIAKSQFNNGFNNFGQFGFPQNNQPAQNPTNNNYAQPTYGSFGNFPVFGGQGTVNRGGDGTQNTNNGFLYPDWDNNQGNIWGTRPFQRPVTAPPTQQVYATRPVPTSRPVSQTARPISTFNANRNNGRLSNQKCSEYEKYVVSLTSAGGLSLGSSKPTSTDKFYTCSMSQGLVVGGQDAKYGEFPHMALLGNRNGFKTDFYCGGSLISESYVLTAAHCKLGKAGVPTNIARFNTIKRDSDTKIDKSSNEFITHPSYSSGSKKYDIALMKLSERFDFDSDKRVLPACLQTQNNIGEKPIATGWGLTEFAGEAATNLQKVNLDIVDCATKEKNLFNTICTSTPGKDTCQGDSGGPLQILKRDAFGNYTCQIYVIGVTSYGPPVCGISNSYAVYTKVSDYLDWIEQKVWP